MENLEKTVTYIAGGVVLGNLFGGGTGAYKTKTIRGNSEEEILEKAKVALENGSLDGGMGFESLIGGFLDITCETSIEIDGKEFVNQEISSAWIGTLSDEQMDFLLDIA